MGVPLDEVADKTINLSKRAADMAAVYNTDVTDAMGAVEAGLRGQNRPLLRYGVNIDAAAVKAKALSMGLIEVGGEMDNTSQATATMALIMEQTALIEGHFNKEAETMDGQLKRLKAGFKDASAELGQYLLPYVTDFLKKVNGLIARFKELTPEQQKNIVVWAGIVAAIGPALVVIGQAIQLFGKARIAVTSFNTVLQLTGISAHAALGPLGLLTGAIALLALGIRKGIKDTKEWRAELDDIPDTVAENTDSYEEYEKAMKDYAKSVGMSIDKNGNLVAAMNEVKETNFMMTRSEYDKSQAVDDSTASTDEASLGLNEYADRAANAAAEAFGLSEMINTANEEQRLFTEELEKVQGLDANFSGIISMAKQYDEVMGEINIKQDELDDYMQIIEDNGGYLDGAWVGTNAAKEKVEELTGEIGTLQQSMTDMANQVALDMFMATISIDTITKEEAAAYFQMAEDMEIISGEAAAYAMQVYGDAIDDINSHELVNKYATYTVNTVLNDPKNLREWALRNQTATYTVNTINKTTGIAREASGGPVHGNTPYIVGEVGPELFVPDRDGFIVPNRSTENNFNLTMPTSNNPEDVATMFDLMQAWVG